MLRLAVILSVLVSFLAQSEAACPKKDFPQFQCASDGKCIDLELTCNSINDCADRSDEALNNCTDGCLFNTTLIKPGESGQDLEWWYTCTRSRWLISGCVVNDRRLRLGDSFQLLTRQGVFWGKCEKLDQYHFMRQPYGCVDANGRNVDNGQTFLMNQLFWGTCSLNKTTTKAPEVGTVQVNDVKWRIAGCNDGSQKPVRDGQEFVWIIDPFRLLGVQILCRVPKKEQEWPDIKPTACVVNVPSNSTPSNAQQNTPPAFKVLRNKCYTPVDKLIYYCTITPKASTVPPQLAGKISTWEDDWLLNITDNTPEEIRALKAKGFSECTESPKVQPFVPRIPLPPPLPPPPRGQGQGGPSQGVPPPRQPPPQFNANANANAAVRRPAKREIHDLWTNVDFRSPRSVQSRLSSRMSSANLAKSITL